MKQYLTILILILLNITQLFSSDKSNPYIQARDIAIIKNDYQGAIAHLDKTIEQSQRGFDYHLLKGFFLYCIDDRFNRQEAYEHLCNADKIDDSDYLVNYLLASIEKTFYMYSHALTHYLRAITIDDKKTNILYPQVVNCLYHLGRYEEAKQYFVEDPDDYYFSMIMGMVSDCLGDVALRDTYVNRAFTLDPFRNHDMYIKHLLYIGRFADAERMIPLMKDDELGVVSKQVFQGYIDMTSNNMKKAEKTLRQVTKTNAGYEDGWQFLMYYWALTNNSVGKVYAYSMYMLITKDLPSIQKDLSTTEVDEYLANDRMYQSLLRVRKQNGFK